MVHHSDDYSNLGALAGNSIEPEVVTQTKKVLLINTRGQESNIIDHNETIFDERSIFLKILEMCDDLRKEGVPKFDVMQLESLKLSADQGPEDWETIAHLIRQHYDNYCGFVVQNGTDNLVMCASALSFMMENLGKPIIFTGSRIPGTHIFTDIKRNIILALSFAVSPNLSEVCLLFDERLYRGNRTIKVSVSSFHPFDSPHFPPLASMQGGSMHLKRHLLRPFPRGKLRVMSNMYTTILTLFLGPSMTQEAMLEAVKVTNARGIVIMAYGSGNGPSRDDHMANILAEAAKKDIVVVICTQNRYGTVSLSDYECGRKLLANGAISAKDMTPETAIVKLKYLFGLNMSPKEVRHYFPICLRGEITMDESKL